MSRTYKYVDKHVLNMINHIARDVIKYNRAVPQEYIDALPDDKCFPVVFSMVHEHKAGKRVEPHMRCMFAVPTEASRLLVDVEMGLYDLLPQIEVADTPAEPTPV